MQDSVSYHLYISIAAERPTSHAILVNANVQKALKIKPVMCKKWCYANFNNYSNDNNAWLMPLVCWVDICRVAKSTQQFIQVQWLFRMDLNRLSI